MHNLNFKQILLLIILVNSSISFNSFKSSKNLLESTSSKRDIIYWTPTTANIIDNPYPYSTSSPYAQVATPYTYQQSPYNIPQTFPQSNSPSLIPQSLLNYPTYPVQHGYYYSPGTTFYYGKNEKISTVAENKDKIPQANKNISARKSNFEDVIGEVKSLKSELFGNGEADMSFYKKNKNAYYDAQWLQRAQKISKILELEELLEFYEKNNKKVEIKVVTESSKKEIKKEEKKIENVILSANKEVKITKEEIKTEKNVEIKSQQNLDKITILKEDTKLNNLRKK